MATAFETAFSDRRLVSGITLAPFSLLQNQGINLQGIEPSSIVRAKQVHSDRVIVVSGPTNEEADALVTSKRGLVLGVSLADCCGILLADADNHIVAAVHSGWRGTVTEIVVKAIQVMLQQGAVLENVKAWMSPCASAERYEVDADVQEKLSPWCTPNATGKWQFDNKAAIYNQLTTAGLAPAAITVHAGCTIGDTRWHSHRRDGAQAGRMLAFVGVT